MDEIFFCSQRICVRKMGKKKDVDGLNSRE